MKSIGVIRSCYREKFGIPRQPGLVESASAALELLPPYNTVEALRGLEEFSHVWILFVFHESVRDDLPQGAGAAGWKATVRPPRLGGNERIGVFASRSNFRPNPIGLSVVELVSVQGTTLEISGGDFLDGTPVLDIKPYIPYADCRADARGAFAHSAPIPSIRVTFDPHVESDLSNLKTEERPNLKQLIIDTLSYNPRPAYQTDCPGRVFGTHIFDLEVKWKQNNDRVEVIEVTPDP